MIKIPLKAAIISRRPNDSLTLNSGLVALRFFRESGPVLPRKLFSCDLSGGFVPTVVVPPLDPSMPVKNFLAM